MTVADENKAVATAKAFATYAMMPFLGILFCPGALLLGSVGLINSRLRAKAVRNSSLLLIAIATVELIAQLTLWWIMYKVPEWSHSSQLY